MIEVVVVPELPHGLILGFDFWVAMGIVPDLSHNEWPFSENSIAVNCINDKLPVLKHSRAC